MEDDDLYQHIYSSSTGNETIPKRSQNSMMEATNDEDTIERIIKQLTDNDSQRSTDVVLYDNTENVQNTNEEINQGGVHLKDPPDFDEILLTDEKLITATSHNVTVLNSACQEVLKEIERQLLTLLKKNRKEQEIVQTFLTSNNKASFFENTKKSSLKSFGMPYFKDMYGFQPPPNKDVLKKQKENQLLPVDFIRGFPTWNNADAKTLLNSVRSYQEKGKAIDWMRISVKDMEGKYSSSECRSKWVMNLDPSVNRSKWSRQEMEYLKVLCDKYNRQNWDKVAVELGTNRTGLQCCIQYMTHTFPTEGKWTKEEDKTLESLVEKFKVKDYIPWPKVTWYFENRSLKQCQERYAYHLGDIKKGIFTPEEDFLIVYLAPKLKNFGEVAKFLPNRVATQVRSRYEYLVELTMPEFSKEEDELLTQLMARYPRNWGVISSHFENRSRVQCRKRWAFLQKKVKVKGEVLSDSENEEVNNSSLEVLKNAKSGLDAENYYKQRSNLSHPVKSSRPKKQAEAYKKLLDYLKNCHKFLFGPKPRVSVSPEDQEKLIKKMKVTMKSLSVKHAGPLSGFLVNELSCDCEFDKEDLDVLTWLSGSEVGEYEVTKKIIPPNFMTLLGHRSLTLNWSNIKTLSDSYEEPPGTSVNETDGNDRLLCIDAKKLFKSRLKALFTFPLILSNITPAYSKTPPHKPKTKKAVKPLSKLRRKEHAKLMNAAYREKLKALKLKSSVGKAVGESKQSKEKNLKLKSEMNASAPSGKRTLPGTAGSEGPLKKRLLLNAVIPDS